MTNARNADGHGVANAGGTKLRRIEKGGVTVALLMEDTMNLLDLLKCTGARQNCIRRNA